MPVGVSVPSSRAVRTSCCLAHPGERGDPSRWVSRGRARPAPRSPPSRCASSARSTRSSRIEHVAPARARARRRCRAGPRGARWPPPPARCGPDPPPPDAPPPPCAPRRGRAAGCCASGCCPRATRVRVRRRSCRYLLPTVSACPIRPDVSQRLATDATFGVPHARASRWIHAISGWRTSGQPVWNATASGPNRACTAAIRSPTSPSASSHDVSTSRVAAPHQRSAEPLGRVHHRGQRVPVLAEEAAGLAGRVSVHADEPAPGDPAREAAVEEAEAALARASSAPAQGRGPPPPPPPPPRPRRRWAPPGAGPAARVEGAGGHAPPPPAAPGCGLRCASSGQASSHSPHPTHPSAMEERRLLRADQLHRRGAERTDVGAEPAHALAAPGKARASGPAPERRCGPRPRPAPARAGCAPAPRSGHDLGAGHAQHAGRLAEREERVAARRARRRPGSGWPAWGTPRRSGRSRCTRARRPPAGSAPGGRSSAPRRSGERRTRSPRDRSGREREKATAIHRPPPLERQRQRAGGAGRHAPAAPLAARHRAGRSSAAARDCRPRRRRCSRCTGSPPAGPAPASERRAARTARRRAQRTTEAGPRHGGVEEPDDGDHHRPAAEPEPEGEPVRAPRQQGRRVHQRREAARPSTAVPPRTAPSTAKRIQPGSRRSSVGTSEPSRAPSGPRCSARATAGTGRASRRRTGPARRPAAAPGAPPRGGPGARRAQRHSEGAAADRGAPPRAPGRRRWCPRRGRRASCGRRGARRGTAFP